jgi:folate-binding protein YgfZ
MTPRHFGDPAGEYAAATRAPGEPGASPAGAARIRRTDRVRLVVEGRSPARMLQGLVTGRIPGDPRPLELGLQDAEGADNLLRSEAPPSVVLTPRGRIVTDLHLLRTGGGEAGGFLLDLPAAGQEALEAHLTRFLPPRFARATDPGGALEHHTVVGPGAEAALAKALVAEGPAPFQGGGLNPATLAEAMAVLAAGVPGQAILAGEVALVHNRQVAPPAWDLVGPAPRVEAVVAALDALGVREAGLSVWHTLRLEGGTPQAGAEFDEETLPHEAGVERSHVDHQKGCYTGQEVVVRIRDRGRVNRHIRGLLLGDLPAPAPGTPVFVEGRPRESGEIRTVAQSPRWEGGIALAMVRREAEPGTRVHLGAADGPAVEVRALGPGWGDPGGGRPDGDGPGEPAPVS